MSLGFNLARHLCCSCFHSFSLSLSGTIWVSSPTILLVTIKISPQTGFPPTVSQIMTSIFTQGTIFWPTPVLYYTRLGFYCVSFFLATLWTFWDFQYLSDTCSLGGDGVLCVVEHLCTPDEDKGSLSHGSAWGNWYLWDNTNRSCSTLSISASKGISSSKKNYNLSLLWVGNPWVIFFFIKLSLESSFSPKNLLCSIAYWHLNAYMKVWVFSLQSCCCPSCTRHAWPKLMLILNSTCR